MTTKIPIEGLYKCTFPDGVVGELAKFKDGSGYTGTIMQKGVKGIKGQARWNPVKDIKGMFTTTTHTTVPIDPTSFFMGAALMNIENKLNEISEMQAELMEFLESDKEAQIKGNLKTLSEIVNNYKFNWDNEKYKETQRVIVSTIKKDANQHLMLYKSLISSLLNKGGVIQNDKDVNKRVGKLQRDLKNYQLSLYIYSFSSFLEVMLNDNFKSEYISNVINSLENMALDYRTLYTNVFNKVEKDTKSTIGKHVLTGISVASKSTGKLINKIPLIEKGPVDEALISAGKKLDSISSKRVRSSMQKIMDSKYGVTSTFINSLNDIDVLYNKPMEIAMNEENIYIKSLS